MKNRDLLQLVILIGLCAFMSAPKLLAQTNTVTSSDGFSSAPDLSNLDSKTRQSIELACVGDFTSGPAPYRKCVERQLESIAGMGETSDLSDLDMDIRPIEAARTPPSLPSTASYTQQSFISDGEALGPLMLIAILLVAFLLPWIVAKFRGHRSSLAIFWMLILLGWTGFGWAFAFIWACTSNTKKNQQS